MSTSGLFRTVTTLCFVCLRIYPQALEPWNSPFADVAAIRDASSKIAVPDDESIAVLFESHDVRIKPEGGAREITRKLFRVLRDSAVEDWGTLEQNYQPWRESKPVIRARVIAANGSVYSLDAATISEAPASQFDSTIFSDARRIRVPLPAVATGSIVEYEITTDSNPALPDAGVSVRTLAIHNVPLHRFRFTLDAPQSSPLHTASGGLDESAIHKTTAGGRVHIEADLGPFKGGEDPESNLPPDVSNWPWIAFSTGTSWQAIATRYAALVDRQIQAADVSPLLKGLNLKGPPLEVAGRLATQLHRSVRYTGLEFGESAIVPSQPADVLARKYGDCKDKATLLIAMLRAAGIPSSAVLLRADGLDVDKSLPGIDQFNHVIVHVDTQPELWIDATANATRIGTLPWSDQGRLALVARPGTTELVRTPEQNTEESKTIWEVHFSEGGSGDITEIQQGTGMTEASLRSQWILNGEPRSTLEKYVKSAYRAKSLGKFSVEGTDDLATSVKLTVEAQKTPQVLTTYENALIVVSPSRVLEHLPYSLQPGGVHQDAAEDDSRPGKRRNDFQLSAAGRFENRYIFYPPALYSVAKLPDSSTVKLGPLTWSREYKRDPDDTVEARFVLEAPTRRLSAAEYEAAREALRRQPASDSVQITFIPKTSEYLAVGETGKAISSLREQIAASPNVAGLHSRLSRTLIAAGLGAPALAEAKKATELDPRSVEAWQALAWARQQDVFGRRFGAGWDRPGAIQSFEQAIATEPDEWLPKTDLAILLEFNAAGERYGVGSDLTRAASLYREVLAKQNTVVLETNLIATLFHAGLYAELETELKKTTEAQRLGMTSALTAMRDGAPRAIIELQSVAADAASRSQYLAGVGLLLVSARQYELANTVLKAASRSGNAAELAQFLQMTSRAKHAEDVLGPDTDPATPLRKLLFLMLRGDFDKEHYRNLFSSSVSLDDFDEAMKTGPAEFEGIARRLSSIGLSRENFTDIVISNLDPKSEGDDAHGYRISVSGAGSPMSMFVTRENGRYVIFSSVESPSEVGALVLDLLAKNDLAAAQWWLDKATVDLKAGESGSIPAASVIWSGTTAEGRSAKHARIAAAALLGRYSKSDRAIQILKEDPPKGMFGILPAQVDNALCEALQKAERWDELAQVAPRLLKSKPFEFMALEFLGTANIARKDWKALEATATRRLAAEPKNNTALRYLALSRIMQANYTGGAKAIDRMKAANDDLDEKDFRPLLQILTKTVTPDTLKDFEPKSEGITVVPLNADFTKPLVQLALADPDAAQVSLKAAVGEREATDLPARAWVALGLLYEQFGLKDYTADAFAKARAAKITKDVDRLSLLMIKE